MTKYSYLLYFKNVAMLHLGYMYSQPSSTLGAGLWCSHRIHVCTRAQCVPEGLSAITNHILRSSGLCH